MLDSLAIWLSEHTGTVAIIGLFSFLLLSASLLATPWVLAKLPANYFSSPPAAAPRTAQRLMISILKTIVGLIMLLTGVIMMFTPGPGLVCMVLGIALCEFPGKQTIMIKLVRRPSVFSALNWLRGKAHKPPFILPAENTNQH